MVSLVGDIVSTWPVVIHEALELEEDQQALQHNCLQTVHSAESL